MVPRRPSQRGPSFAQYRRRIVGLPDGGSALVRIRRNTDVRLAELGVYGAIGAVAVTIAHLRRLVRRDRSWRVEIYLGVTIDDGGSPSTDPHHVARCPDRVAAEDQAEALSRRLATDGVGWLERPHLPHRLRPTGDPGGSERSRRRSTRRSGRPRDIGEATALAEARLDQLRPLPYGELVPLLDRSEWRSEVGPSGTRYAVQVYGIWDVGREGGPLRIVAAASDGSKGRFAFERPALAAFIVAPSSTSDDG